MSQSVIRYHLDFSRRREHIVAVTATFPVTDPAEQVLQLQCAVWTPGSYLIREYARQIETVEAWDAARKTALPIKKTGKANWDVTVGEATSVQVRYAIYCRELSVRTNWVDDDFALLNGAATFLTSDSLRDFPCSIEIDCSHIWRSIACSLPTSKQGIDNSSHTFERTASSYDELVDSPILVGDLSIESFEVAGKQHYLATLGGTESWNSQKAADDCKKIVEYEHAFWGEVPYESYWFINLAMEGHGGLEHDNNTVLLCNRGVMDKPESYNEWLGLVSHEFFHTWNVRRLRPKALMHYDYQSEQMIEELWIAEGITSYYDDLVLIRANLVDADTYLGLLDKTYQAVEKTPGRHVQSLRDSSFDTWIKHYRPDENSLNSRISYYTQGAMVAFLLDMKLREVTSETLALDDVMRELWRRFRGTGYTLVDFEDLVSDLAHEDLSEWFHQHVRTPVSLNYEQAFSWLGLESAESGTAEPDLGFEVASRDGRWIISRVYRGGSAHGAGLQVDDEIIAIDGWRVARDSWKDRINNLGKSHMTMSISRRSRMRDIVIEISRKAARKIRFASEASKQQRVHRRNWLFYGLPSPQSSAYFD